MMDVDNHDEQYGVEKTRLLHAFDFASKNPKSTATPTPTIRISTPAASMWPAGGKQRAGQHSSSTTPSFSSFSSSTSTTTAPPLSFTPPHSPQTFRRAGLREERAFGLSSGSGGERHAAWGAGAGAAATNRVTVSSGSLASSPYGPTTAQINALALSPRFHRRGMPRSAPTSASALKDVLEVPEPAAAATGAKKRRTHRRSFSEPFRMPASFAALPELAEEEEPHHAKRASTAASPPAKDARKFLGVQIGGGGGGSKSTSSIRYRTELTLPFQTTPNCSPVATRRAPSPLTRSSSDASMPDARM